MSSPQPNEPQEPKFTRRLTTEQFIQKAKKKHGDRYDYSCSVYTTGNDQITIRCPKHGTFSQKASNHINGGFGCPSCGREQCESGIRLTNSEIIDKFVAVHGDLYDYSEVEYQSLHTEVSIRCHIHGVFRQMPSTHLRGCGCQKCAREIIANKNVKDRSSVIQRFREVHGDTYDYDQMEYAGSRHKIAIRCRTHGVFHQLPSNHMKGVGCPTCGIERSSERRRATPRVTPPVTDTAGMIARFKSVHGDTYDYSKAEYVDCNTPVVIVCPEHGEFHQKAPNHYKGSGCMKCAKTRTGMANTKTHDAAIADFKAVHGNYYDYSRVKYTSKDAYVEIGCPIHGWFMQRPTHHLRGSGCQTCNAERHVAACNLTQEELINKFITVHGDEYDYSLVNYQNMQEEVTIVCKVHGSFRQSPATHARGSKCPNCSRAAAGLKVALSLNVALERSVEIHGQKYDYSRVHETYQSARSTVTIICQTHGPFEQVMGNHLRGSGCPRCSASKGEDAIANFLDRHNITYFREYTFDDHLVHRKRFDFFIPSRNTIIEFHGIQHYQPVSFSGGESEEELIRSFKKRQKVDRVKKKFALKNGIKYVEIPYTDFDNIHSVLMESLFDIPRELVSHDFFEW